MKFENCYWCQEKQIAAICSDTWGVEVRPNETTEANQPWHWVVIPAMGLTMGEMFYLKDLAEDCAADGIYEFFFCGPPLVITGGTGSPHQSAGDQVTFLCRGAGRGLGTNSLLVVMAGLARPSTTFRPEDLIRGMPATSAGMTCQECRRSFLRLELHHLLLLLAEPGDAERAPRRRP